MKKKEKYCDNCYHLLTEYLCQEDYNIGWMCPLCKRILSPYEKECTCNLQFPYNLETK